MNKCFCTCVLREFCDESYFYFTIGPSNKAVELQVIEQGCEVTGHPNVPKIT
jgi:hypothetical protein